MSTPKQYSPLLRTQRKPDSKYVDLAVEMQYRASTAGEKEEINPTYFIYQTGHVQGPYTVDELLGKCVRNEIHLKSEKILFCPTSLTNNYSNQKNVRIWHTLQQLKDSSSVNHDKLYSALYPLQQLMDRIIHHPPVPHNKLLTDKKHTFGVSFHQTIRITSILLSKILFIFISLHFVIPLILCTFIYCILYIFCCSQKKLSLFSPYSLCVFIGHTLIVKNITKHNNYKQLTLGDLSSLDMIKLQNNKLKDTHYVSIFIGFIFTPLTIIMVLNHYYNNSNTDTNITNPNTDGDDKNTVYVWPWMIAYSVWCLFFIVDYFCINLNLWYKHLTKLIVGIHVTNVHKQDLLLILCALGATLPAVIFGYLANYMLDEKLTLTCTADTASEICIENKCCYIVSSHEVNVGNMIALFGLLRLLSWMVTKADMTIYDTIEPLEVDQK